MNVEKLVCVERLDLAALERNEGWKDVSKFLDKNAYCLVYIVF